MSRGFGVAGALDRQIVRRLAEKAERLGYDAFWANDTPGGDGLGALSEAAAVTTRLRLGVGVIPLDRQPSTQIAERVASLGLPPDRLILGVGSGRAKHPLQVVEQAVVELKDRTRATVIVGALGPKMCALGGRVADGVLLNWLTPTYAELSSGLVRHAASKADRPSPLIAAYVRTALGPSASERLREEATRYAGIPSYAAHFERMGAAPMETSVVGETVEHLQQGLAAFTGVVDETVVRAIVGNEGLDDYLALLEAAAPSAASD